MVTAATDNKIKIYDIRKYSDCFTTYTSKGNPIFLLYIAYVCNIVCM